MHVMEHDMIDLSEEMDDKARQVLQEQLNGRHTTVTLSRKLGVNRGLIPYVLGGGHSPTMLEALGLPIFEKRAVPVCLTCGNVHTMHKTCQETRRVQERWRKSADMKNREDLDILENVAKYNGFASWTKFCRRLIRLHEITDGHLHLLLDIDESIEEINSPYIRNNK